MTIQRRLLNRNCILRVNSGTLKYWGKLVDVRPAIATSSVYVLPSYREGTPRTVLEANGDGAVAVINKDANGCRETVVDGDNGFLVEVKSIADLVKPCRNLLNSLS